MSINLINGYTNKGVDPSRGVGTNKVLGTSLREDIEMKEAPRQENHSMNNNDLADIAKSQIHHQKLVIARLVSRLYRYLFSYCDILNNFNL